MTRRFPALLLAAALAGPALAQDAGPGTPAAGLAPDRLARLDTAFREAVAEKKISGAVVYVARGGRVVDLEAFGSLDVEKRIPMPKDAIFRIASMSKAVTTVAALMLVEEGRISLDAPVSRWIPSFAKTTVFVPPPKDAPTGAAGSVVPAKRPITILDLMTHTAGISYGGGALAARYKAAGAYSWYLADKDESLASFVTASPHCLSRRSPENASSTASRRTSSAASSKSLREEPRRLPRGAHLQAAEDARHVVLPLEGKGRAARNRLRALGRGHDRPRPGAGLTGQGAFVEGPRRLFSGGAGLLSTAADYGRFLQMLLNGGELDGVRLLSPKTVELATSNHVGSLYQDGHLGFGLGFEVTERLGPAGRLDSVGAYGWGSSYYARYFVDPKESLVAFFLAQLTPERDFDLHKRFRTLVYQSIVGGTN